MRILLRALVGIVLLLVASLVAAALILPGVVAGDEFRDRLVGVAEAEFGREVRFGAIDFGLFPPSLVVEEFVVASAAPDSPPVLEGDRIELRAALLPLFARALVVDRLSLHGARLHLVRTDAGFETLSPKSTHEGGALDRFDPEGADDPDEAAVGFDLAVAAVDFEAVDILLEDRSVSPPVIRRLHGINARAFPSDRSVELDFEMELANGGMVSGSGEVTLAGVVDLEVKLSEVVLEHLRSFIDSDSTIAGRLNGRIAAVGPAADLESLRVDATLVDGRFSLDDLEIAGSVRLIADLHGSVMSPRGTFDIDATGAEVRYGGIFTKPPGDAATVRGKLVEGTGGSTAVDDIHFKMENFKGRASLQRERRPQITESPGHAIGIDGSDPAEGISVGFRPG